MVALRKIFAARCSLSAGEAHNTVMRHENNQAFVSDARLLRRFTRENSQAAFAALVARHSRLVYSVCRRDVGNAALAEDAAQAVFLLLARKAPALRGDGSLAGWLYRTARLVSKNALRRELRVRQKEQRAAQQMAQEAQDNQDALWERIDPRLHAALDALGRVEREAVLLRFWDGLSLAETGAALGLSEDAARMRVTRALEKLKRFLVKEGVVLSTSALAGLLTEKGARAAPAPGARPASPNAHQLAQGATRMIGMMKATVFSTVVGIVLGGAIWGTRTVKPHHASLPPAVLRPASPTTAIDPQAQAVITQAATATTALHSLKADITVSSTLGGKSKVLQGTLAVKRPNFMRVLLSSGYTSIADGTYRWDFFRDERKLYKFEAFDGRSIDADNISGPLASFFFNPSLSALHVEPDADQPAVRYAGDETWHGIRCQVVELKFQKMLPHTLWAYFGPDHLLRRCVWRTRLDSGTTGTNEVYLSNVATNISLSPALFTFAPPANVELHDVAKTQQFVREMQKKHQVPAPTVRP